MRKPIPAPRHKMLQNPNRDEPSICQDDVYGFSISWNPDDNRFYITNQHSITVRTFKGNTKGFSNLVWWCKHNQAMQDQTEPYAVISRPQK